MYIYSHMSAKIVVQLLFCNKYIFGHKQCSTLYFEIQSSCHIIQFKFTLGELNDLLLLGWGRHPPWKYVLAWQAIHLFFSQWVFGGRLLRKGASFYTINNTLSKTIHCIIQLIYVSLLLDYTPAVTKLPKVVPSYSGNSLSFDNSISQLTSTILSQYSRALFLGASLIIIKFVWPFTPPKISIFPSDFIQYSVPKDFQSNLCLGLVYGGSWSDLICNFIQHWPPGTSFTSFISSESEYCRLH